MKTDEKPCPKCAGTGQVPVMTVTGYIPLMERKDCPTCKGTGRVKV